MGPGSYITGSAPRVFQATELGETIKNQLRSKPLVCLTQVLLPREWHLHRIALQLPKDKAGGPELRGTLLVPVRTWEQR